MLVQELRASSLHINKLKNCSYSGNYCTKEDGKKCQNSGIVVKVSILNLLYKNPKYSALGRHRTSLMSLDGQRREGVVIL